MHPALDQLQKVLKLEIKDGYPNKAVIGGLPKMLGYWEPNARRAGLDPALIDEIVSRIRVYPETPPAERAAAVEALLRLMQTAPASNPAAVAPPRRTAEPPAPTLRPAPVERSKVQAPPPRPSTPRPPDLPRREPGMTPPGQPPPLAPQAAHVPIEAPPSPDNFATEVKAPAPPPAPSAVERRTTPKKTESDVETLDPRPVEAPEAERRIARHPFAPRSLKAPMPRDPNAALDAPLTVLNGVGPETASKFERLGLKSLRDLLLYFPRRYDNYARMKTINRLVYGEECSVVGTVYDARVRRMKSGRMTAFKVVLSDTTGMIEATFFNQDFLARQIRPGQQIVIAGKVNQYLGRLILQPKEWEPLDQELLHTGRIVPVYPLTQGITQHNVRKLILQLVDYWARKQPDPLPADVVQHAGLMGYAETLAQIHYPNSEGALAAAQHRLAFDELLLLQLGVLRQRRDWQAATGVPLGTSDEWLNAFLHSLPYTLTGAQQRTLADIRADLARNVPMNRLLQGDVGSGKTAVAAAAMAIAAHAEAGAQAALLAPTSILAEQHYRTLSNLLAPALRDTPATRAIRLLQGSTSASEKDEIYAGLRSGEIRVVIGTHALIEAPVEFANLGLAIVDEQHRFGVAQRAALRGKGSNPHVLVMTATPIPRSLALTVYGDLDLSVLDEMPPGRQPIETHLLRANEHERGYAFIRSQLQKGRQAFIIFPLVEESEKIEAKAAVEEHVRLQKEVFPDFKLGLLHGRMRPDEKDEVMTRFRSGDYHVLVSTSVVEVGVDVPNATVILIEGANRFGLAQLHQFRGRVGRGEHKSSCLLASDDPTLAQHPDERLLAMEQTQDGFVLAEKDLHLRGPGDFLGTRQSGYDAGSVRMAKLGDLPTIEKARREARRLFESDPDLQRPEHQSLAEKLTQFWTPGAGDVS